MMKFTKILSGMLVATLISSAFTAFSVSAATQSIPYINDFGSTGDDARFTFTDRTGNNTATVEVVDISGDKKLVQKNATGMSNINSSNNTGQGQLVIDFTPQSSGTIIVQLDRGHTSSLSAQDFNAQCADGIMGVYTSAGVRVADLQINGRGQNYSKAWHNGAWTTALNNANWQYGCTIKYEIDLDNGKYKIFQGDNQLSVIGSNAAEFEFSSSEIAQLRYNFSQNEETIDNIKIYKLVEATQTATKIDLFVGDRIGLSGNGLNITNGSIRDFDLSSSNEAVATVAANGRIRGISVGTATITAKNEANNIEYTYTVNVCDEATQITINGDTHDVEIGTSKTLTYTTPAGTVADTVVWSSSDPSIASVNSATGEVTGVAKGTATITASCFSGTVTDTCTVNVVVPLSGLTIIGTTNTLNVGDSTALSYSLTPSDANIGTMKWRSGNHYVATVSSSGVVTAVGTGSTEIYLSIGNLFASYSISVNGTDSERRTQLISYADVKGSFSDIADMPWAQSAVQNVAASGIMTPDSEYFFGAKRNITREELVSVVIKTLVLENEKADESVVKTFDDVDESNPYYADIMKAVELGIIAGVNDTSFAPKDDITRQDLALVVMKALEVAGIDTVEGRLDFNDKDSIATYAQKAVRVLNKMNIMIGKNNGNFDPLANTTRAEVAVISEKITAIR